MDGNWVGIAFFAAVVWIAWIVFSSVRRYKVARLQSEVQASLLQRIDSSQSLIAYAETPAGRQFVDSLTVEREQRTPYTRILNSVQAGIVLTCFGLAMLWLRSRIPFSAEGFTVFGTLAVGLGVGFGVSGAASYILSRSFGLLEQGPDTVRRG
ncbi:hypothetical protein [Silvibacterium dinghuense]|uniref:Uncharacterized protein n=1 Tax=Silvibacterium dinghuense TaxID=1560006 RepID=A0A4V1NVC7_9BACT|nr:hypothetical protein [Silvibacterium dinghuense]RXS95310.1 hypothetical protein ESZ00_12025 [Silvibacterium dinghuense]GGH12307.1 hypothetical protein GCM10011586_31490 [Silvibacterium dinghuense]